MQYNNGNQGYNQQQPSYNQGYNNQQPSYNQGYDNRGASPQPPAYGGQYDQQQQHNYGGGQYAGQQGPDGERGLGATLVGGGVGAFAAKKSGSGMLGALGAAAAGAIGANIIEHKFKKHHHKHHRD